MTFYCLIGQEMLNFVTNCCKLLKVNQAAKRAVSSTVKSNRKAMNRNWSNQKANPALKTKAGNK